MTPEIIYEDKQILVVYKPANVPTQTARLTEKDMVSILQNYRRSKGEDSYIGIIQRLDQPVEGILLCAKTKDAAAKLSTQQQNHQIEKQYYAVICQPVDHKSEGNQQAAEANVPAGRLVDYLAKDAKTNTSVVVPEAQAKSRKAKKALLTCEEAEHAGEEVLVRITLGTGRHHQIRVQLSSRGWPILGDVKYGGQPTGQPLALCAYHAAFAHPKTGEKMDFTIQPKGEAFLKFRKD